MDATDNDSNVEDDDVNVNDSNVATARWTLSGLKCSLSLSLPTGYKFSASLVLLLLLLLALFINFCTLTKKIHKRVFRYVK